MIFHLEVGKQWTVAILTLIRNQSPPTTRHGISKRTMCRPTRKWNRGRLTRMGEFRARTTPICCTAACTQGKRTQHGKPQRVIRDDQPDAREGQAGRAGVAERLAVPLKPGNAGGGKGPQFKTDARRGEGPGDWAT